MKYVNACLFTTFILITVVQIGCLSTGAMGKAEKLVEAQDYRGAIDAYQSIVTTKPNTAAARAAQLAIGELYIAHINQPEQGTKTYQAVIAEAPDSDEAAEAHYRIGMHAYRQKDFDTAQTRFEAVVTQFPHLKLRQNAHLMLAKSYEGGQKYEHAVKTFEDFANCYPRSKRAAQARANKARIQRKILKNERAESPSEKLKKDLEDLEALLKRNTSDGSITSIRKGKIKINNIKYSPDGTHLSVAGNFGIFLYNVQTDDAPIKFTGHSGRAWRIAFSPDKTLFGSVSPGGTYGDIYLLDVNTGERLRTITEPELGISDIAFSPDGRTLVSGNADHTLCLFDVDTGKRLQTLIGHTSSVTCVAFSPDGMTIAAGGSREDSTVRLWDARTGELRRTLTGHAYQVFNVEFSPDGTLLTSGGLDRTVRLWDVKTGKHIRKLVEDHPGDSIGSWEPMGPVQCVAFSPDGRTLASFGGLCIRLWDVKTGKLLRKLRERNSSHGLSVVVFSPDGKTLAVCGSNEVDLWDVKTGQQIRKLIIPCKFLRNERIESHVEKPKEAFIDPNTSPFGFGPYLEVPAGYRFRRQLWESATPEHELLERVRLKLWKQGTQIKGAMFDNNGLIYPTIPGVIYVEWRTVEEGPLQFVGCRYAAHVMGHPNTAKKWSASYLTDLGFERTDVKKDSEASGIKVYDYPDGGIDPYKFLDLPKSLTQNPLHED